MVNLKKAELEDGEFILEVRNDNSTLKFLHDSRKFSLENFKLWFEINNPQWFIIQVDKKSVGYIRTKWIEENEILQVGADVHPSCRGLGYGKTAYILLFEHFNYVKKFTLEVFADNFVAINLYEKLGFVRVSEYEFCLDGTTRISVIMEKMYN